ncbi:diguanylate cyclase [Roseobacter sp.]|uniref:diguanylate cyclase domain-containing protein n=1 Tax=Roseobacter sp. TaxID=1907202 RepID=UPI0032973F75
MTVMHYVVMSAYVLPGHIIWEPQTMVVSCVLGVAFGAGGVHRLIHPVTRYCWLGGAVFFILSICAMHFTGMAAFYLELSPFYAVPEEILSDIVLGVWVFGVTSVIFVVGFVGINIELDSEHESVARVQRMATLDALIGLPNRVAFVQYLAEQPQDKTINSAVLSIGLDRFKEINDLHGYIAGDIVLCQIAQRLSVALGDGEFIARAGG